MAPPSRSARFDGYFVSNEFPTFDIDTDRASPAYIGWLFRCSQVWRALASSSTGMGDRRQRIHPERILEYQVHLPPLAEQRRIAAQLDQLAGHLDAHRRAAEVVGRDIETLLRVAFDRITAGTPRARMGDVAPLVRRSVDIKARVESFLEPRPSAEEEEQWIADTLYAEKLERRAKQTRQ